MHNAQAHTLGHGVAFFFRNVKLFIAPFSFYANYFAISLHAMRNFVVLSVVIALQPTDHMEEMLCKMKNTVIQFQFNGWTWTYALLIVSWAVRISKLINMSYFE